MKIEDLKIIIAVVRCGSISKAARNLYLSQPSLSQTIRKIEKELNVQLFIRENGKVATLTNAGEEFLKMAESIVPEYETFLHQLKKNYHNDTNKIRIGITHYQGTRFMSALLTGKPIAGATLDFREGNSDELEKLLCDGCLDYAIIRLPLKTSNLNYCIIDQEALGIYLKRGTNPHQYLAPKKDNDYPCIAMDSIKNDILALPPESKRLRITINLLMDSFHFIPKEIQEFESKANMIALAENGIASTIGTHPGNVPSDRFYWIADAAITYDLALVYCKDQACSPATSSLYRFLKKLMKEQ